MVCKSKLGGFNFICTECGALYCEKCVRALIELENGCWVCQEPFDESKPIKLSDEKVYLNELHKNTKK